MVKFKSDISHKNFFAPVIDVITKKSKHNVFLNEFVFCIKSKTRHDQCKNNFFQPANYFWWWKTPGVTWFWFVLRLFWLWVLIIPFKFQLAPISILTFIFIDLTMTRVITTILHYDIILWMWITWLPRLIPSCNS